MLRKPKRIDQNFSFNCVWKPNEKQNQHTFREISHRYSEKIYSVKKAQKFVKRKEI